METTWTATGRFESDGGRDRYFTGRFYRSERTGFDLFYRTDRGVYCYWPMEPVGYEWDMIEMSGEAFPDGIVPRDDTPDDEAAIIREMIAEYESEPGDDRFFRFDDLSYYRSESGSEYVYVIDEKYDALDWTPGCGSDIHPFQFHQDEKPVPAGAEPDEPDPAVVRIVRAMIGEFEAEEV